MILNASLLYPVIWFIIIGLYQLHLSLVLIDLNSSTYWYVVLTSLSFLASSLFVTVVLHRLPHIAAAKKVIDPKGFQLKIKILFSVWLVMTAVEILTFKSLPLLSLMGDGARYTEWGIPSLHGMLNAIILTVSNYLFYRYLVTNNRKYLYCFVCCLLWPLALMTRQLFMSMIAQSILIYLSLNRIGMKKVVKLFLCFLAIICIFGVLGDVRSGQESFVALVQPSNNYPKILPSGFLWVYTYVTTPLNNLNYNINTFDFVRFKPLAVVSSLVPSFLRGLLPADVAMEDFQLVNDNLNVSTMHPVFLYSFGYVGSIFFYFLMGVFMSFIYYKWIRERKLKWMFINVVLLHNILFSGFVNFFTHLVFVFQILLHYYLGTRIVIKSRKSS